MVSRKFLVLVMVCLMVAGTLLGCTQKAGETTAPEASPTTEAAATGEQSAEPAAPAFRKVNVALNSDPETMAPWGGATVGG